MDNNNLPTIAQAIGNAVDDIKVPSVDSIGEMPKVDLPSVDSINPAQPQPTAPTYVQPTAPTYAQPTAATYAQPTAPTYAQPTAAPYAQPAVTSYTMPATNYQIPVNQVGSRTVGQKIALIFGIVLTVLFGFLTFCVAVYDIDTYNKLGEVDLELGAYIVLGIPLIIGILLIVLGARKKQNQAISAPAASYAPTAASYPAPSAQSYSAPVATSVPTATPLPTATPVATATPLPTADPAATATASDSSAQAFPVSAPAVNTASYQYAPTTILADDTAKVARKTARKSALIAIACIVVLWVLVFTLDLLSWYLLIIPFVLSFRALKSYIKSPSGWFAMILSILSTIVLILLVIAARTM